VKKHQISKKEMGKTHPAIPDAYEKMLQGRITRRDFLRFSTLLGLSSGAAYFLAACGAPTEVAAPAEPVATAVPVEPAAPAATAVPASGIKRGGTWTSAMELQLLDHPARLSWVQGANIVRQVSEYLTETGADNVTRPLLLDRWEASDDVKTWDLYLKEGIKFNNGDPFTSDDVMFTFGEWLNPDVGSSMLGLMAYLRGMQDVEKVDDYHVRLHLQFGDIAVPEHLFHYPAVVLHRGFEGDIIKKPVGTGAFTLEEYAEGERAVFKRRTDYWQKGADGDPLPYLDQVTYVSTDMDAGLAALQSGQVDSLYQPRPTDFQALQGVEGVTLRPVPTSQALIGRMRVDLAPWDDVRVRNALKMCQDRAKILQLAYFGEGDLSLDAHVAPSHPEYCEKPVPKYDPEGAKALLQEYAAEKGIELPLKVTLATKNDQSEPEFAQALKELAEPAGFEIALDITDPAGYWDRWTEVDLGITTWTHRPLATMVLPLAYTKEAIGNWNETRWTDDEFETVLREAQGTLDVEARRALMCTIEDIMQERGPIFNSFWKNVWNATNSKFQNVVAHPTAYDLLNEVWKDE
jgi:peptide/nickel transport system substrate-binding protein